MFERFTEQARRVIFFAHHEAGQFGSPYELWFKLRLKDIEGYTRFKEAVSKQSLLPQHTEQEMLCLNEV